MGNLGINSKTKRDPFSPTVSFIGFTAICSFISGDALGKSCSNFWCILQKGA